MVYKGSCFILRTFKEGDEASLALNANNYNIWITMRDMFPHPYTYDDAVQFVKQNLSHNKALNFVIDVDGDAVGVIGIIPGEDIYRKTVDIGYWLGEQYWGKGIVSEAIKWLVAYCYSNFEINKIAASCFSTNKASIKVLEKCGFIHEATRKQHIYKNGIFIDENLYALIKKD